MDYIYFDDNEQHINNDIINNLNNYINEEDIDNLLDKEYDNYIKKYKEMCYLTRNLDSNPENVLRISCEDTIFYIISNYLELLDILKNEKSLLKKLGTYPKNDYEDIYASKIMKINNHFYNLSEIQKYLENYPEGIKYVKKFKYFSYYYKNNPKILNILTKCIQKYPYLIKYIEWQNLEICELAFNSNPYFLKYLKCQSDNMVKKALKVSPLLYKYVLNPSLNEINKYGNLIFTKGENKMHRFYYNPKYLKYLDNQDLEICRKAIDFNHAMLKYAKYQDLDMCIYAVNKNPNLLKYAKYQNLEMCSKAVNKFPYLLKYAKYQNIYMCLEAIKKNLWCYEYYKRKDEYTDLMYVKCIINECKKGLKVDSYVIVNVFSKNISNINIYHKLLFNSKLYITFDIDNKFILPNL